ncbi:MAG: hypothetical protein ACREPB_13520, partial [Arenimonas sp.]
MKKTITDITPVQAVSMQADGVMLIDVRESDEHALGLPKNALAIPRAKLEQEHTAYISNHD